MRPDPNTMLRALEASPDGRQMLRAIAKARGGLPADDVRKAYDALPRKPTRTHLPSTKG